jgi:hypothetical protein
VPYRPLAALLLLLATAAVPQLLELGAHLLAHHDHPSAEPPTATERSNLAQALVHGHRHGAGIPEHDHQLLPAPPSRLEASQALPALHPPAALAAAEPWHPLLPASRPRLCPLGLSGSGPPRLHLLGALLI